MSRNPFRAYPTDKGPVKLMMYGEPGTLKTRRALGMPGPRFMVDLEKGADEYGDLIEPGVDQYLSCQSSTALSEALDYLESLRPGQVGTLIVDPITVVWQSLQAGHAERQARKKRIAPEEVMFDQGVWSRLNRVHNDIVTRMLNAPFHVVMVARGKELRENDQVVGYGYDGHKSLEFLAKTVVQTRRGGDHVVKDRSGTWAEGHRASRLDLSDLVTRAGTGGARMETATEAAGRDGAPPPEPWQVEFREALAQLPKPVPFGLDTLSAYCESRNWPTLRDMQPKNRLRFAESLADPDKHETCCSWCSSYVEDPSHADRDHVETPEAK